MARRVTTRRTRSSIAEAQAAASSPNPVRRARKTVIGIFTFWYEMTSLKNSLLALVLAARSVGPGSGRMANVPADRGCPPGLLLLPVLYLNVSMALLLALGRYSVPVLPALLVLSAFRPSIAS